MIKKAVALVAGFIAGAFVFFANPELVASVLVYTMLVGILACAIWLISKIIGMVS